VEGAKSLIVSRLYISRMSLDSKLIEAARKGDVRKVRELLDRGANVNARDMIGDTPLHDAAYHGFLNVAKLLLDRGADVNAKDMIGYTPLHWAAREGHLDVARLLLERGADAGVRDNEGKTPLDRAREKGYVEVARVIEEYGRRRAGAKKVKAAEPGVAGAPSILGVEYSSLYAGEWGRLLVRVKGAGPASLVVEGGVEWMDPGRVMLSGESVVEVPVKPVAAGELPVRVTVRSEGGEDVRIAWLKVSEKARKAPHVEASRYVGRAVSVKVGKPKLKPLDRVLVVHGYECRSVLGKTHISAALLCVDKEGTPHVLKVPSVWYEFAMGILPPTEAERARRTLDRIGALKKEAEALEAVRDLDHPCIVRFEGALESGGGSPPTLVFEFCEGGSLDDILSQHGKLDKLTAAEIFIQIADALAAIHEKGYTHGDIKPGNILFSKDRIPKLADFNSARAIASASRSEVPYTPGYASPEQLRERRPSREGDVWSLALTIYEAVTGSPLIPLERYEEVVASLQSGLKVETGDKELDEILSKCLKQNPGERPSMRELRDMLVVYLEKRGR